MLIGAVRNLAFWRLFQDLWSLPWKSIFRQPSPTRPLAPILIRLMTKRPDEFTNPLEPARRLIRADALSIGSWLMRVYLGQNKYEASSIWKPSL